MNTLKATAAAQSHEDMMGLRGVVYGGIRRAELLEGHAEVIFDYANGSGYIEELAAEAYARSLEQRVDIEDSVDDLNSAEEHFKRQEGWGGVG